MAKDMNRREVFKTCAAASAVMIAGDLLSEISTVAHAKVDAASDKAFDAAKAGFTWFHAYTNTVAKEIGRERAISLMTKTFENMGAMQGKMIKERAGVKEFDAQSASSPIKIFKDRVGQDYEVSEASPQKVVLKTRRCPVYEAARTLGMNADAIETVCRAGPVTSMEALLKQLNPNLNARVKKFRSAPDDFCEEEIILI